MTRPPQRRPGSVPPLPPPPRRIPDAPSDAAQSRAKRRHYWPPSGCSRSEAAPGPDANAAAVCLRLLALEGRSAPPPHRPTHPRVPAFCLIIYKYPKPDSQVTRSTAATASSDAISRTEHPAGGGVSQPAVLASPRQGAGSHHRNNLISRICCRRPKLDSNSCLNRRQRSARVSIDVCSAGASCVEGTAAHAPHLSSNGVGLR